MAEQAQVRNATSAMQRWSAGRSPLLWNAGTPGAKWTFEDDLALFERQVREEVRSKDARSS